MIINEIWEFGLSRSQIFIYFPYVVPLSNHDRTINRILLHPNFSTILFKIMSSGSGFIACEICAIKYLHEDRACYTLVLLSCLAGK
jgi:hypothetical protein